MQIAGRLEDYRLPAAIALDSGNDRSCNMAATPRAGPIAKNAKAAPHPTESDRTGTSRMVPVVSKNPKPVWNVRAVPRYASSDDVRRIYNKVWAEKVVIQDMGT